MKDHLACEPDYITISGSGEPTLHSGIGSLIKAIKAMTNIPVAVLTNGSLLWIPEVRNALSSADLVIPSLDAGEDRLFRHVNRPHREITFQRMVEGLCEFRKCFSGQYWLEVLLLGGITALPAAVKDISLIADQISPDQVHLNTVVRPPAESFAIPAPRDLMESFAGAFASKAEVIGSCEALPGGGHLSTTPQEVLALVSRRPCTLEDIASGLDLDESEALKGIETLSAAGLLVMERQGKRSYFKAARA